MPPRGLVRKGLPALRPPCAFFTEPPPGASDRTGVGTRSTPATLRVLLDLALGAGLATIVAALVWHLYPGFWKDAPQGELQLALQRRVQLQAQQAVRATRAPSPRPEVAASRCGMQPLIPPGGSFDGQARLEHPFPAGPRARAKVFLRAAEAAEAQGRPRDAETALLAACRESERASPKPSVPLARVLATLGEHYADAARDLPQLREPLLARTRAAFMASVDIYAQALGPNASRTRQAQERLAALDADGTMVAAMHPTRPDTARAGPVVASPLRTREATPAPAASAARVRSKARAHAGGAAPEAQSPRPAPAPVAAGPEFRQLASDLERLRAQAEAVSDDPSGLRMRADAARASKDRCQDAACLRGWYAQRRQELLAEF